MEHGGPEFTLPLMIVRSLQMYSEAEFQEHEPSSQRGR